MRILVAPQGFKGTLTGLQAAEAIAEGVRRVLPEAELTLLPIADGGHGTLDALMAATAGTRHGLRVTGPLGATVDAEWGVTGGPAPTAVIEMAQASGLTLVPESLRDPMRATTYGTGQLIAAALGAGHRRIIVGVGGSATNDGAAGAAQALGLRLTDASRTDIAFGAEGLLQLASVDLGGRLPAIAEAMIRVATDVSNPLTGPTGAAMTYGPQKGGTPAMLPMLDAALANMADVAERDLGVRVRDLPGGGAAGGLAAGLVAFLGAELSWGADVVLDALDFDRHLTDADLLITGEGRIDWQTVFRKAPIVAAERAAARGVTAIAVAGSVGPGADDVLAHGIALYEASTAPEAAVPESTDAAEAAVADAAERAIRAMRRRGRGRGSPSRRPARHRPP
jgi:glycerate kinase